MRVDSGAALTYRDLHEQALRWAAAYQRLGVRAGTHVATMIPNSAEAYIAWLGLGWLRAIEVPLNNGYTGKMLQYTLSQSDSTMLVIHRRFVDRLASIAAELPQLERVVVLDDPVGDEPVEFDIATLPFATSTQSEFLAGVAPAVGLDGPEYRDITAIIYTSGTTGPSKGVIVPWSAMLNMWSWAPRRDVRRRRGAVRRIPQLPRERQVGVQRRDGARRQARLSREVQRHAVLGRRPPYQVCVGGSGRTDDRVAVGAAGTGRRCRQPAAQHLARPDDPRDGGVREALRSEGRYLLRHDRDRRSVLRRVRDQAVADVRQGPAPTTHGTRPASWTTTTKKCRWAKSAN